MDTRFNVRSNTIIDSTGLVDLELIIHPHKDTRVIIINAPGFNSHIDGFNNKWRKIGTLLGLHNVGAFVQMPNINRPKDYAEYLIEDVRLVCRYVLDHAREICATDKPDIYMMGCSSGAGAVSIIAREFPEVKRVLLIAPAVLETKQPKQTEESFAQFEGQVYITIGAQNSAMGAEGGERFLNMARNTELEKLIDTKTEKLVVIPQCDHHFTGTKNGKILSKAPLWAFADDLSFPSPEGGIVLY